MEFFGSKGKRVLGVYPCETTSQATSQPPPSRTLARRRDRSPGQPAKEVSFRKKRRISIQTAQENPVPAPVSLSGHTGPLVAARPCDHPRTGRPTCPAGQWQAHVGDRGTLAPLVSTTGTTPTRPDRPERQTGPALASTGQLTTPGPLPRHTSRPNHCPAGDPHSGPPLAQAQISGLVQRRGPQIPVRYEVGDLVLEKHAGRPLDPEAPVFLPLAAGSSLDDDLAASPDVLDDLLAAAREEDDDTGQEDPPPDLCGCHSGPLGSCPRFIQEFIDTVVQVLQHDKVNMDGARVELRHRQIDPAPWEKLLGSYFDKTELVAALRFGWDFSLRPDPSPKDADSNLPSAREFSTHVDNYLQTELRYGAIVGPLPGNLPFKTFRSPLGTVPKPHCPEKRRIIVDCTQRGEGINLWIPHDIHRGKEVKTRLPGTTQIVAAIKRTRLRFPGEVVKLWKCDYARFYRQFLSCPSQSPFLCIGWEGQTYVDRVWSFGNRGACQSSQRFSSAVAWVFRTQVPPRPGVTNSGRGCRCSQACGCGDNEAMSYIDDTIGVAAASNAEWLFRSFLELVQGLTLKLSQTPGHISPPACQCVALGILYDTETNLVSLPEEKLVLLREMLDEWSGMVVATPRQLASLSGRLLWAAAVVVPGRVFLGRVLSLKRSAESRPPAEARRPVTLDSEFRLDLAWWATWTRTWNGKSFLEPYHSADVALDASSNGWSHGEPGIGAYSFTNNQYLATGVPEHCRGWPIADLELVAHLLVLRAWGQDWSSLEVNLLTDNEACRSLLQNGRSRIPRRLALARAIVSEQIKGNYRISSDRISTHDNTLADCLSRWFQAGKRDEFWSTCSRYGVAPERVDVPPHWFEF